MIVNTVGTPGAKMFFVGEAPGEKEDESGQPFHNDGRAGRTFNQLLIQAGISRLECLVGNVAREKPPGNRISFFFEDPKCTMPKPKLIGWLAQLKQDILLHKPNVIVALGATALWALTGEKTISTYRGFLMESTLVPGVKVLPTYHPQAINHSWPLHFPVVMDLKKALHHSKFPSFPPDKRKLEELNLPRYIDWMRHLLDSAEHSTLAVDIETVQPGSHISIMGIADSPKHACSVKLLAGDHALYNAGMEFSFWQVFAQLMEKKDVIMQNASYDTGVLLLNHNIHVRKLVMDTLLAAHVLWPESPRDLGFLASICLDVPAWKKAAKSDNHVMYNAADVANTYGVYNYFVTELVRTGNVKTFRFEMEEIPVSLMMQLQGLPVDIEIRDAMIKEHTEIYKDAEQKLNSQIKRTINYNSPAQLQQLLYVDMGLPVQYKRRKKASDPRKVTAGKEALEKLARENKDNPLFNLLLRYKKSRKLVSSFLDIELSPAGRVHTSYNLTGSSVDDVGRKSFGRWSSSESIILPYGSGNLQNIPEEARKMYRAKPGWVILCADYVQAEAVVVAYLARDYRLIQLFNNRRNASYADKGKYDVHKFTASSMFQTPIEEVSKEMRGIGKTLRHATNYSAGPGVVMVKLGCSMSQAKVLLATYLRTNPHLLLWQKTIQQELRENRTLETPMGRKHKFLERWGDSLFRSAYSFKPQSTVGDLMNVSLIDIEKNHGHELELWLQLHDGAYFHLPKENVPWAVKVCQKHMSRPITINNEEMVIEVDFKVGPSWGELEDLPV